MARPGQTRDDNDDLDLEIGPTLNEPQPCPECGREGLPRSTAIHRALAHGVRGPRIDRRFARVTLTGPDRRRKSVPLTETEGLLLDYIDDLEREARGIPLIPDESALLCGTGCGCRVGTDDSDRADCGCDGPCCWDTWDDWIADVLNRPDYYDEMRTARGLPSALAAAPACECCQRGCPCCGHGLVIPVGRIHDDGAFEPSDFDESAWLAEQARIDDSLDNTERWEADRQESVVPIEEGETHEQQQQRLRREEEDRL